MPNALTKLFDRITGVEEDSRSVYAEDEYVTVDFNKQQMENLEQAKQPGQITVKLHKLKSDMEYQSVLDLVRNNHIVILDISLVKNSDFTGLKMLTNKLKQKCDEMRWGIGALSNELIMITPTSVRFEKKKQEESKETIPI
ncbi:MAG: hypothetical protein WC254_02865 [Candidatus Woesearchaeota archaeon]|jgi:SepF-like predicted cell division protein (DUF552 family)